MAIMIPEDDFFDPRSGERKMFDALKAALPDDYYVLHSFHVVNLVPNKGLNENEIDFIVYNHKYGALFLECKNSKITYEDNKWYYLTSNGEKANMKDPFNQAFSGLYALFNKLKDEYRNINKETFRIISGCKTMIGVWLPKYTKDELRQISYIPNFDPELVLGMEELNDSELLKEKIDLMMEKMNKVHLVPRFEMKVIDDASGYKMKLTEEESKFFFDEVLCPRLRMTIDYDKNREEHYKKLLEEQYIVLDFLSHQRTAAISGDSGTGKTLVAVERARRLSYFGEKVLFLCYNVNLKTWLEERYASLTNVTFSTLDALCVNECKVSLDNISYSDLKQVLENKMRKGIFKYRHIIVDEGQDFGIDQADESELLDLFSDYGNGLYTDKDIKTSFFIFYDKNQLVNSKNLPSYLNNVDSKLTLYKNCRNTQSIAQTAFTLIDKESIVNENSAVGKTPSFIFYESHNDFIEKINNLIKSIKSKSTVIITCNKSLYNSEIYNEIKNVNGSPKSVYKATGIKTNVYTTAKFKGLESDNVILLDIDNETFDPKNKSFYVGASRAKYGLYVFVNKNKLDVENILRNRFNKKHIFADLNSQLVKLMKGNID